jgi:RND superfamily putative drug exporter
MSTSQRAERRFRPFRWLVPALLIIVWLGVGGWLGALGGKLGEVIDSGAAGYLPSDAESVRVLEVNKRFGQDEALPAVIVYSRDGTLDVADKAAIGRDMADVERVLGDHLAQDPIGPILSEDGHAAQVIVPFAGTDENKIAPHVQELRDLINPLGDLDVQITGPAGVQADILDALGAIDLMLLLVTAGVILLILVLVYRSPLLPFLVLTVAGTALTATHGVIYLLAKQDLMSLGSEVQGILNVLVLGAGTDYALLLIARYREELRRHENRFDAMRAAMKGASGAIIASAGTVVLGLLCLLASDLGLNSQLGPAGALGIGMALVAMLTLMPAVLVLLGRAAFWPRRPRHGTEPAERTGGWARVAGWVGRRPRLIWIGCALVLAALSVGALRLDAEGLSTTDMIVADNVESKVGQQVLADHYPAGAGNPVLVIAYANALPSVLAAIDDVPNVESAVPYVDPATVPPPPSGDAPPPTDAPGVTPPAEPSPMIVDDLVRIDVTLSVSPDSRTAIDTVRELRETLADIPVAQAMVGGLTAVRLDFEDTARADRMVIPIVIIVVFLVLALLLRALVAPLLLMLTVVVSFLAAIGVSAVVFQELLGFPGVDSTFPLHAFVFLVALGVDYNIFLMTRVREEAEHRTPRDATLVGLTVTGGVITSAGVVLAATFAALAVIPLVLMIELAFTVAFGVLLDTLLVRSLLVPALSVDFGRAMWWPSRLAKRRTLPAGIPGQVATSPEVGESPHSEPGERELADTRQ